MYIQRQINCTILAVCLIISNYTVTPQSLCLASLHHDSVFYTLQLITVVATGTPMVTTMTLSNVALDTAVETATVNTVAVKKKIVYLKKNKNSVL